jgi:hypothetical protein
MVQQIRCNSGKRCKEAHRRRLTTSIPSRSLKVLLPSQSVRHLPSQHRHAWTVAKNQDWEGTEGDGAAAAIGEEERAGRKSTAKAKAEPAVDDVVVDEETDGKGKLKRKRSGKGTQKKEKKAQVTVKGGLEKRWRSARRW